MLIARIAPITALALLMTAPALGGPAVHEELVAGMAAVVELDEVALTYQGTANFAIAGAFGGGPASGAYGCDDAGAYAHVGAGSVAFQGIYRCVLSEGSGGLPLRMEIVYAGSAFGTAVALQGQAEPGGLAVVCRTVYGIIGPAPNGITIAEAGGCEMA